MRISLNAASSHARLAATRSVEAVHPAYYNRSLPVLCSTIVTSSSSHPITTLCPAAEAGLRFPHPPVLPSTSPAALISESHPDGVIQWTWRAAARAPTDMPHNRHTSRTARAGQPAAAVAVKVNHQS